MKKSRTIVGSVIAISMLLMSCQSNQKKEKSITLSDKKRQQSAAFIQGEALFKGKGNCYSCHRAARKSIGPSILKIMEVYKAQDGDIIGFLQQKTAPIVDPENYSVMKTNFAVLKHFSEQELKALAEYMNEIASTH